MYQSFKSISTLQVTALVVFLLLVVIWRFLCHGCCPCPSLIRSPEAVTRSGRDLPPSYSKADLFSVAVPVYDHLHPPPNYLESVASLQYLDLERGQGAASRQSSRSSIFSSKVENKLHQRKNLTKLGIDEVKPKVLFKYSLLIDYKDH